MKNELSSESSPYLLQHAHNPVHWQPWSESVFSLAKEQNKPVLVSIGYSACHWCHVMERESFENEDTAALMNEYFINVKIDREERPDVDHVYMEAVQAMTGSGGWPLNLFVTPEGKPFYGGTYFPPVPAFNRSSWPQVLASVHDAWVNRKEEIESQADNLLAHLTEANELSGLRSNDELPTRADCEIITENLLSVADTALGGFGKAPKFPQTFSVNCLLRAHYYLHDAAALKHATFSLTRMIESGIYDQVRGGLCRYSTDAEWRVPHFEKMLYDNALFLTSLSDAYKITRDRLYADTIMHTFHFLQREMRADKGYMAALDADSEGEEGKFYLWTKVQLQSLLSPEEYALIERRFSIREEGNFQSHEPYHAGQNILHVVQDDEQRGAGERLSPLLQSAFQKLQHEQDKRVRPGTDDKVLLGWNALLLKAFCNCYAALGDEKLLSAAVDLTAELDEVFLTANDGLLHTYKNGQAKIPGFLDDYAYYSEGLLALYQVTLNDRYLKMAEAILRSVVSEFSDEEGKLFYYTRKSQTDSIVRKKEIYDGAVPAGNSIAATCLLKTGLLTGNTAYIRRAQEMASSLKVAFLKHPGSFGNWAALWLDLAVGMQEITVPMEDKTPAFGELLPAFLPNAVFRSKEQDISKVYQLCVNNACGLPVRSAAAVLSEAPKALFNGPSTI